VWSAGLRIAFGGRGSAEAEVETLSPAGRISQQAFAGSLRRAGAGSGAASGSSVHGLAALATAAGRSARVSIAAHADARNSSQRTVRVAPADSAAANSTACAACTLNRSIPIILRSPQRRASIASDAPRTTLTLDTAPTALYLERVVLCYMHRQIDRRTRSTIRQ
jgi:hypothetical protein